MNTIDDATLDVLAAQATDPDHEPQDRADAAAVLGELVAGDVWAVERIAAALAKVRQRNDAGCRPQPGGVSRSTSDMSSSTGAARNDARGGGSLPSAGRQ